MSTETKKNSNFPVINWVLIHPRLSAWIFLSIGMVALLVFEARDVGLLPGQWIALIVATILVAGACIWIVSWEDSDEMAGDAMTTGETNRIPPVEAVVDETVTPADPPVEQ